MNQAYKLAALVVGLLLVVGFNVYYFVLRKPENTFTQPASMASSMARRPSAAGAASSRRDISARSRRRGNAAKDKESEVTPANAEKPGLAAAMGLGSLISSSRQEWVAAKQPEQITEGQDSKAKPKAAPSSQESGQAPATAVVENPDAATVAKDAEADASKPEAADSSRGAFGAAEEDKPGEFVLVRTPLMYDWEALYGTADLQSELEGQADSPIGDRVIFTGLAMTESRGAMRAVALINGSFFREGDEIEMGLILQRIDPRGGKIQVSDGKELAVIGLPSLFVGDSGGGEGGVNVRRGSDDHFGQGNRGGGERDGGGGRRGSSRGQEGGGGGRQGSMGDSGGRGRGRGSSSRGERGGGGEGRGSRGGRGGSSIPGPRRGQESGGGRERAGGAR